MIKLLTESEKLRFEALCKKHAGFEVRDSEGDFEGIGIFNEKRLHRVLKEFVCEDESCFEVKLGTAIADVFCNGVITEIQTAGFYPLKKKVQTYLESTDCELTIAHPIICERKIVRVDPLTGEILYSRRSPKKQTVQSVLPELIYLSDHLRSHRLKFDIYSVRVEEHRYSDEIHRYRKSGKRDCELFPIALESITTVECSEDFLALLPEKIASSREPFTAAEYEKQSGIRGRKAYNALGALCAAGVLEKEKTAKKAATYKIIV